MNHIANIAAAALVGLLSTTAAQPAAAQDSAWRAYSATRTDGTPGCGMRADGYGMTVALEWYAWANHEQRNRVYVILLDSRWADMPRGLDAPTVVHVDGLTFTAIGRTMGNAQDPRRGVVLTMDVRDRTAFLDAVAAGREMRVRFPNGAQGMDVSLRGSAASMQEMLRCVGGGTASQTRPSHPATPNSAPAYAPVTNARRT